MYCLEFELLVNDACFFQPPLFFFSKKNPSISVNNYILLKNTIIQLQKST